jgi:haloacetate dehalogenase
MAYDMVIVIAYRMALDHPNRINRLAVLDILPTATVWDRADSRFALAIRHPERLRLPLPLSHA